MAPEPPVLLEPLEPPEELEPGVPAEFSPDFSRSPLVGVELSAAELSGFSSIVPPVSNCTTLFVSETTGASLFLVSISPANATPTSAANAMMMGAIRLSEVAEELKTFLGMTLIVPAPNEFLMKS